MGEWFLGSILFLYLLFPLLQLRKAVVDLADAGGLHPGAPVGQNVHILNFVRHDVLTLAPDAHGIFWPPAGGAVLAQPWTVRSPARWPVPGSYPAGADRLVASRGGRTACQNILRCSFVHHVLIQELAAHFDLAVPSAGTAFLFVVHLAATFAVTRAVLLAPSAPMEEQDRTSPPASSRSSAPASCTTMQV